MPEMQFDGAPANGTQVTMTNNGPAFTPYRVTVTRNGQLVLDETFTLKADAQQLYDREMAAINAPRP